MGTSAGGERISVFRFGEFTFDCGSHLLLHGGVELHLSPKAQQLLRLLLLHRARAVSRKELYDALWPATFVCETNLATVISEVRRALGDSKSNQYIRTVHGFGYAFAAEVTATRPQPIAVAMLVCEQQRHVLFDGENSVGRASASDIVLADPTVSRHHAVIVATRNEITIEDLGSRNGTFVHGQRIGRAVVRHQDVVLFGAVEATVMRKISGSLTLPFQLPRGHHPTGETA